LTTARPLVLSRWRALAHVALVAALILVALVLRIRELDDIPRYTDEVIEVMTATDIARGRIFPLVSPSKHIGAYFNYLIAGVIVLVGKSPDLPRYVALAAGLATVLLTYGYARRLGGPLAGLAAAGLLAVSAPHVLLSSRVAWSASLTPLLLVGAVWALDAAVTSRRPRLVPLAGLLAGLALQAHPSVLALLPGLAVFVVLRGRWLFRRPELYLAGLLFLLGCANVLVYNVQSGLGGARSVNQQYAGQTFGPAAYFGDLPAAARGVALVLASAVDPLRVHALTEPFVLAAVGVCAVSLGYVARRASPLPLVFVLSALACLPFLHDDFDPLLKARYTMPLVPIAYAAVGVLVARLLATDGRSFARAYRLGGAGLWLAMAAGLLGSLLHFEQAVAASGCSNAPQRALVAEMERHRLPGEWVLLDETVVRPVQRLGYLWLLEWSGRKVGDARLLRNGVKRELAERPTFLTVVNDGSVATVFVKQGLPLLASASQEIPPHLREGGKLGDGGTGLYRVTAEGATLLAFQPPPTCDHLRTN
ncbi:MAG: glycosyltransferase family 39 protein, partial [Chloroflexota bacterium]|nr:glycosyltransferase family 39 protein [Chloroflexota bacterium]